MKTKKITIVTTTRADYGLLAPIIKGLKKRPSIIVEVVATGTHLSLDFGRTIEEVRSDGVHVDEQIAILSNEDTAAGVAKTMANALSEFSVYFEESRPDALMVLGDRYEVLAICLAALIFRIPIIHLHGGEITEGAIDNAIRHAITKLSCLHFASTEAYRHRIIQMGESPDTVFTVGAPGVENALHTVFIDKKELEAELGLSLSKYALLTFHPVTLENNTAEDQIKTLLNAAVSFPDILFICSKANADQNGTIINRVLKSYAEAYPNIVVFDSLGSRRYLSLMKNAAFVIGNSSSGIIEAPSFKIPTINIGDRQKGRIQAKSIINCPSEERQIKASIARALSPVFRSAIANVVNPYGDGSTSEKIVSIVEEFLFDDKLRIAKRFYDIKWPFQPAVS